MANKSETDRIKEIIDVVMKVTRGDYSAQLELSDKNDNLDSLVMGINMLIEVLQSNKEYKFPNEKLLKSKVKVEEIFRVPKNTLVGRNLKDFFNKEQFRKIKQQTEIRRAGKNSTYELTISRSDKQKREILVTATPDYDQNKIFQGTIGTFRDIANRKKVEDVLKKINITLEQRVEEQTSRLKESEQNLIKIEEKHDKILDTFVDGVYITSPDYTITYLNRAMTKTIGNNKLGAKCHKAIYNLDEKCSWCIFDELKDKKNITYELKDPVRKRYHTIRNLLLDDNSKLSIFYDTTELRKTEQKLSLHIEQTPLGVIEWDLDFKVNSWNKAAEKIFGYSKDEAIGKSGNFIIPQDARKYAENIRKKLIVSKQGMLSIIDIITKNGERINCEWHNTPLVDTNGEIIGIASLVQDITKQKQAEKAIESSEKKFRSLFEKANDAIFLMDEDKFIDCNKKALEMFACSRKDIIGLTPFKFSPELQPDGRESKEKAIERIKASLKGNISTFEWVHAKLNGEPFYTEVSLNSFILKGKKVIQAIVRDISERKNAANELLKSNISAKEEEMKRFASDIHDGLGPLLLTSKLYIDSLRLDSSPEIREQTIDKVDKIINEAILSTKEIVNNMYPSVLKKNGFIAAMKSYCEKVSDTVRMSVIFKSNTLNRFNEEIEISLYRVISELINNTIKYADATKIDINITYNKQNLFVYYMDNGIGFNIKEVLNNPNGMGITNIHNRIKFINGQINIKNDLVKGIIFEIKVPVKNKIIT